MIRRPFAGPSSFVCLFRPGRLAGCGRPSGARSRCDSPRHLRQRGTSSLQRLFRAHFPELVARHGAEFAKRLGRRAVSGLRRLHQGCRQNPVYQPQLPNGLLPALQLQRLPPPGRATVPPLPLLLSEADPPVGRVHERAAPAAVAAQTVRVHPAQGSPRLLPPRQEASRGNQPPRLRVGAGLHNGGRRQVHPHRRRRIPDLRRVFSMEPTLARPVPGGRF